ncbi:hypothetical protein [Bdellovibrio sp. HCB-110]|uniref:hypothetical protein n=1 Tax=Bdellovibrio sp. HCB-110 TaxID=3391182 RepID=UPI0039B61593
MNKSMSLIVITLAFLFSMRSHAEQLSLFPEIEFQEHIQQLKDACENVGNGDCDFATYNVAAFNEVQTLRVLAANLYDADRGYQYEAETNWKYILSDTYVKESGVADVLKYFVKNKMVKAIYGFTPNSDQCTESEYCSIYIIYIYLTDGQKISFTFDFTT